MPAVVPDADALAADDHHLATATAAMSAKACQSAVTSLVSLTALALTLSERRVVDLVASRERELVELLRELIAFDTVTHEPGAPAREEAALQAFLARRLSARGARVRCRSRTPLLCRGHPMVPDGFTFTGRPQLVARFPGAGGGRTLLLCGHVDVVDVRPRAAWASDPFRALVSDGEVWGRGACDMKGGVACMVFAAEVLAECGVRLAGDLIVNTVTEEESTGAGGLVSARTVKADAAIVPEPSALAVWLACRGSLLRAHRGPWPRRARRAAAAQPRRRRRGQRDREDGIPHRRDRSPARGLGAAPAPPVPLRGRLRADDRVGRRVARELPGPCTLDCHIEYLPDATGDPAAAVQRDFETWIARAADADPWLRANPPRVEWLSGAVPPAEVPETEPVVETLVAVEQDLGRHARIGGLDNWHDGATLVIEAGIPAVCYGPGDIYLAHTTEERVPIGDLVACAQGIALAALRFCRAS